METKANRQRKMPPRKERVEAPLNLPDSSANPVQAPAVEFSKEYTQEAKPAMVNESVPNPQLGLVVCPECGQKALFWNRHEGIYKCVNPECKRTFTLEEYQNTEAGMLPDRPQVDQGLTNVSAVEVIDKLEPATAEEAPSTESTVLAIGEAQPAATGQIQANESPVAAIDEIEPVAIQQTTSQVSTTEVKDEEQAAAVEGMPSNVSRAEAKDEIVHNKVEEISPAVLTTQAGGAVKAETKSAKNISRNLAFLLVSVLAIGIVIMGIFLFLKSGNVSELSSKLDKSEQALAQSQAQLAASQQDVEGLRAQLTQAQLEVEALQAEINGLKPLTPNGPFVFSGELSPYEVISFPIDLGASERVEGTITGGLSGLIVYIQDSQGNIVENLGQFFHSSFTFTAQTSDKYSLVIKEPSGLANKYVFDYTVYRIQ